MKPGRVGAPLLDRAELRLLRPGLTENVAGGLAEAGGKYSAMFAGVGRAPGGPAG